MDNRFETWPRGGSDTWDDQLSGEILTNDFFGVVENIVEDIIANISFLFRRRRRV